MSDDKDFKRMRALLDSNLTPDWSVWDATRFLLSHNHDDKNAMLSIREACGMTQAQMAAALDISLRSYQDQEALPQPKRTHLLAAQQIQQRMELDAVDVTMSLPDMIDEIAAQVDAGRRLNLAVFEVLTGLAASQGAPIDFDALRERYGSAGRGNDAKADLISRRGARLAADQFRFMGVAAKGL